MHGGAACSSAGEAPAQCHCGPCASTQEETIFVFLPEKVQPGQEVTIELHRNVAAADADGEIDLSCWGVIVAVA